jgi:hypothetical protein
MYQPTAEGCSSRYPLANRFLSVPWLNPMNNFDLFIDQYTNMAGQARSMERRLDAAPGF